MRAPLRFSIAGFMIMIATCAVILLVARSIRRDEALSLAIESVKTAMPGFEPERLPATVEPIGWIGGWNVNFDVGRGRQLQVEVRLFRGASKPELLIRSQRLPYVRSDP